MGSLYLFSIGEIVEKLRRSIRLLLAWKQWSVDYPQTLAYEAEALSVAIHFWADYKSKQVKQRRKSEEGEKESLFLKQKQKSKKKNLESRIVQEAYVL